MSATTLELKNLSHSPVTCEQCDWFGELGNCETELVGEPLCPCCSAEVKLLPLVTDFEPMPKREKPRLMDWFELGLLITIATLLFAVMASQ